MYINISNLHLSKFGLSCILTVALIAPIAGIAQDFSSEQYTSIERLTSLPSNNPSACDESSEGEIVLINALTGDTLDPDNLPESFSSNIVRVVGIKEQEGIKNKQILISKLPAKYDHHVSHICDIEFHANRQLLENVDLDSILKRYYAVSTIDDRDNSEELAFNDKCIKESEQLQSVIFQYNQALLKNAKGDEQINIIELCIKLMQELGIEKMTRHVPYEADVELSAETVFDDYEELELNDLISKEDILFLNILWNYISYLKHKEKYPDAELDHRMYLYLPINLNVKLRERLKNKMILGCQSRDAKLIPRI